MPTAKLLHWSCLTIFLWLASSLNGVSHILGAECVLIDTIDDAGWGREATDFLWLAYTFQNFCPISVS